MGLSNDERGWVMTILSGIACVLGASIICIDIIVRQFPGKRHFRIQDSDAFLSASLSLSFGVMLFSALYSMLPSARSSLEEGGLSPKRAAWTLIGSFIGGVVGIQILSRILHHFIPSHVVDCEHTHPDEGPPKENGHVHVHEHARSHAPHEPQRPTPMREHSLLGHMRRADGDQRSSRSVSSYHNTVAPRDPASPVVESEARNSALPTPEFDATLGRPSLQQRLTTTISKLVSGEDPSCNCDGPCHGFTEPCGQECFKNITARGGTRAPVYVASKDSARPPMSKSATAQPMVPVTESTPLLQDITDYEQRPLPPQTRHLSESAAEYRGPMDEHSISVPDSPALDGDVHDGHSLHKVHTHETTSSRHLDQHHHHHVPTNAFLSIGLQTSIAIALHKLPEGFITYATNHANPKLGVSVFLALFIHNITEGFVMALPLYLAINSRFRAMLVSFILGGFSQPLGAGVAALWFQLAGKGDWEPSEEVYGAMFAVTAGIMASVALQLFSESLDLTHSRMLCMVGAFTGMTILGISSALTA